LALERGPAALAAGHRAAVGRLLLELPGLALDGVGRWVVAAEQPAPAMQRAAQYRARAVGGPAEVVPFDEQVWQLAESRLPEPLYRHSSAVRAACAEMAEACWVEPAERMVIVRDLSLAAGLHDWFSDVDPARLLVLAREWDLPISGVEWANPVLLHGRLAVEVARALYDAETRLGTERFHRIERIVLHHTVGACDATLAEKVFALADWRSRSPESAREPLPSTTGAIDAAYRQMFVDKAEQVRRRGGILAPQTDDLVASAA
jgi:HD superfamily phosphohydrolase YqeK